MRLTVSFLHSFQTAAASKFGLIVLNVTRYKSHFAKMYWPEVVAERATMIAENPMLRVARFARITKYISGRLKGRQAAPKHSRGC
jgi:hypothetical protein